MAGRCFVSGCYSGLESLRRQDKKENKKHPQIFSAPKNWTMLQIWSHIIPTTNKMFSITDKICELHFTEEYLVKFHELNLKDGEVVKVERKYGKLKPGAIPTIFPDFPQYSKNVKEIVDQMCLEFPLHISEMDIKIDEQMENYLKKILELQEISYSEERREIEKSNSNESLNVNVKDMNTDEINFCNDEYDFNTENRNMSDIEKFETIDFENEDAETINLEHEDAETINLEHEDAETINLEHEDAETINLEHEDAEDNKESEQNEITFDVLVKNLKYVSKPNKSWSVTSHGKFVICAKWNKEYLHEKRVVIDDELNCLIFVNDIEIASYKNLCINDYSDISKILHILDK